MTMTQTSNVPTAEPVKPNSASPHNTSPSNKPRRNRWFGRFMKRSNPASACVDPIRALESDLKELERQRNASSNNIALMSLEDIRVGKACRRSSMSKSTSISASVYHAAFAQDEHNSRHSELYSLKRLGVPKKNGAANKEAMARALQLLVREATILTKLGETTTPNHIVQLRGLPCNLAADPEFFLLTNRLHSETLVERIRQWRRQGIATPHKHHILYTTLYGEDETNGNVEDDDTTPNDDLLPRKANYAFQIAKAIKACHEAGIILRDLSPSNVGFRQDDPHCVQLFDLGHAQDTRSSHDVELHSKEPLCGKRRYMAGETWMTGEYSYRTDVYSWSMIFYEMCTERPPYQGMSAVEHQKYVCEGGGRPHLTCHCLPEEMDDILMNCWEPDPSKRWTIYQVCDKVLTLLMQMDSYLFFEPDKDDFLFDIYVPSTAEHSRCNDDDDDDSVSVLGADDDFVDDEELAVVDAVATTTSQEAVLHVSDSNWIIPADCVVVSDHHHHPRSDDRVGNTHGTPSTAPPSTLTPEEESAVVVVVPSSTTICTKLSLRTSSGMTTFSSTPPRKKPVKVVSSAA